MQTTGVDRPTSHIFVPDNVSGGESPVVMLRSRLVEKKTCKTQSDRKTFTPGNSASERALFGMVKGCDFCDLLERLSDVTSNYEITRSPWITWFTITFLFKKTEVFWLRELLCSSRRPGGASQQTMLCVLCSQRKCSLTHNFCRSHSQRINGGGLVYFFTWMVDFYYGIHSK